MKEDLNQSEIERFRQLIAPVLPASDEICLHESLSGAFPQEEQILREYARASSMDEAAFPCKIAEILKERTPSSGFVARELIEWLGLKPSMPGNLNGKAFAVFQFAVGYYKASWLLECLRDPQLTSPDSLHPRRGGVAAQLVGLLDDFPSLLQDLPDQIRSSDPHVCHMGASTSAIKLASLRKQNDTARTAQLFDSVSGPLIEVLTQRNKEDGQDWLEALSSSYNAILSLAAALPERMILLMHIYDMLSAE